MGIEQELDAIESEAIASSEKELFADAMGQDEAVHDESGDRNLEDMGGGLEGRTEHDEDDEGTEETEAEAPKTEEGKEPAEDKATEPPRDPKGRFESPAERGLRTEMLAERDKRKAAESELAKYRETTEARLQEIMARLAAPPAPQPQTQAQKPEQKPEEEQAPDRWTDPEGYDKWHRELILKEVRAETQKVEQRRIAYSFEEAKGKHGEEFSKAYQAADKLDPNDPVGKQLLDTIMQSPNPGERLMAWHRQRLAMQEIGSDPVAYRERVAAELREQLSKDPEFRKSMLGQLQAEAGAGTDGRPAVKLPPSLSSARGGSVRTGAGGNGSDAEIFSGLFPT